MSSDLTGKLLLGKPAAEALSAEIISDVTTLAGQGIYPRLATIRVGERDDDVSYEASISRTSEKLKIEHKKVVLPAEVSESELEVQISKLSEDTSVDGILIFRPLPSELNEGLLLERIAPSKDIDGVTSASMTEIYTLSGGAELRHTYAPCTAEAVVKLLEVYDINVMGKHAVVVGRSLVIGKPVSQLLLSKNATVTIAHSKTQNLSELTKSADIVVVCAGLGKGGRGDRLGAEYFTAGQAVVDVGIHVDDDGLYGDVDTEAAISVGASVSPVPRGLGSVTTYLLMKHVAIAAKR